MKQTLVWLVAGAALAATAAPGRLDAALQNRTATIATLFACGGPEVLTLRLRFEGDTVEIVERTDWHAGRSEGMPAAMVPKFKTTDDCKPIDGGTRLLVTSSSGGLAIIERANGKTEFYGTVPNAHSADVLPGGRVVAAASTSPAGNRLIVFDRKKSDVEVFTTPLVSAHGTHWVEGERTLWALGLVELQAYELADWAGLKPSLKLRDRFKLPSRGGHDLSAVPGTSKFVVTTEHEVLILNRTTRQFVQHPQLGGLKDVKSVTVHPKTGRTAFTLADPPDWWTYTVRFLDPAATLKFPNDRLYKVRWAPENDPWTVASDTTIRQLLAERIGPNGVGAVVGVVEPAGTRVVAYARSGAPDSRPLDGDTVFQIGSITKVFTGLLLADSVVRGEVGLEDPVARYLPEGVRMPQRGRPITLLDLSKHWSALPSMPTNFDLDGQPNPYAAYTAERLYEFLSTYELPREPGKQSYSNVGVALLGRLLARRNGQEYEPFLKTRVLEPLGLRSTSITLTPDQRARLAPGHDRYRQPVETWELVAMPASGSLRSSVNDLLRFLAANLDERAPLHQAMALMRTPGRALGWGRSTLGGEDVYGHEGGKEGYRSAIVFNPRRATGVVVLTNARADDSPMELARHILFRDAPLRPPASTPIQPEAVPLDASAIDAAAGVYRLDDGREVRIARRGNHLLVDVVGDGIQTFFPSARDRFYSNTTDAEISFVRGAEGPATALELRTGETRNTGTRRARAAI